MKKSVNKFALALWIFAALYFVIQVWVLVHLVILQMSAHLQTPPLWGNLFSLTETSVLLASLGVVIELLDGILWQLKQRDDQN